MSSRPSTSDDNKPDSFCKVNGDIAKDSLENLTNIPINQTKKSWSKFREQSIIRWHLSELEGYISDEFRSVKFAD